MKCEACQDVCWIDHKIGIVDRLGWGDAVLKSNGLVNNINIVRGRAIYLKMTLMHYACNISPLLPRCVLAWSFRSSDESGIYVFHQGNWPGIFIKRFIHRW